MLEQFWTENSTKSRSRNKNKTSNLISTNKLRQSKKHLNDNRTEQLITYESTFVQGGYTTFVTVPSGECFANPKRCKNVNNSRQHAARVALVHCMFGGAKTTNVKTCNSSMKSYAKDNNSSFTTGSDKCQLCGCDCQSKNQRSQRGQKVKRKCSVNSFSSSCHEQSSLLDSTLEDILQNQSVSVEKFVS